MANDPKDPGSTAAGSDIDRNQFPAPESAIRPVGDQFATRPGLPTNAGSVLADAVSGVPEEFATRISDGPPTSFGLSSPGWFAPRSSGILPSVPGYEILEEIGRGGMGVVYQARQIRLNRICALKMILQPQHGGEELAVRFLAEAESVAKLHHPNIVQIHAIGEVRGLAYIELEYVAGGSLEKELAGNPSPPRVAAVVAEKIARAIQNAHEAGVIHRDLKPANILLSSDGTPKVSDFGLAKSIHSDSGLTRDESMIGTPSYMAPEQAFGRSKQVGPLCDVYSLGAILYEMLTGRPPFLGPTIHDTIQQVKFDEPVPPRVLQRGVPRDLETIALKALSKEPSRRYESAAAMADDLRRYLEDRPILARPVGLAERTWRLARRRPIEASLLGLLTFVVTIAVIGSAYAAFQFRQIAEVARQAEIAAKQAQQKALQEAERANDEAEGARRVSRFLVGIFEDADPIAQAGRTFGALNKVGDELKARDVLDRGAASLQGQLLDHPTLRATLLDSLGRVYIGLGELELAEPLLAEALALRRRVLKPNDLELAESLHSMGMLHQFRDNPDTSALFEEAIRIRRDRLGQEHPLVAQSLFNLGIWNLQLARNNDGLQLLEDSLKIRRKVAAGSQELGYHLAIMAYLHIAADNPRAAAGYITEALAVLSKHAGSRNIADILRKFLIIKGLEASPFPESAFAQYENLLSEAKAIVGPRHFFIAVVDYLYAQALLNSQTRNRAKHRDELHRSDPLFTESIAIFRAASGPRSWTVATVLLDRARARRDAGRFLDAEADARAAVEIYINRWDQGHSRLPQAAHVLGALLARRGDGDGALRHYRLAVESAFKPNQFGADHVAEVQGKICNILYLSGKVVEADRAFRDTIARVESTYPDNKVSHARIRFAYAEFIEGHRHDLGKAEEICLDAMNRLRSIPDDGRDETKRVREMLEARLARYGRALH